MRSKHSKTAIFHIGCVSSAEGILGGPFLVAGFSLEPRALASLGASSTGLIDLSTAASANCTAVAAGSAAPGVERRESPSFDNSVAGSCLSV